jgi:4-hydroxy-4-methyl-2-oxoglutarate aldolase
MSEDSLLSRLEHIPGATICDAYLKLGIRTPPRYVMRHLRPLIGLGSRAVGRARTQQTICVRDAAASSIVSNRALHFELVDRAEPGDVLVLAIAGRDELAAFGDVLAMKAKQRGVAAVIVDGYVRDAAFMETIQLPIWCLGITMIPQGYGGYSVQSVNQPVTCAGVEVHPGDLIIADGDGVIVLPIEDAERVIQCSEELEAAEQVARKGIESGTPLELIYPSRDYYRKDSTQAKTGS